MLNKCNSKQVVSDLPIWPSNVHRGSEQKRQTLSSLDIIITFLNNCHHCKILMELGLVAQACNFSHGLLRQKDAKFPAWAIKWVQGQLGKRRGLRIANNSVVEHLLCIEHSPRLCLWQSLCSPAQPTTQCLCLPKCCESTYRYNTISLKTIFLPLGWQMTQWGKCSIARIHTNKTTWQVPGKLEILSQNNKMCCAKERQLRLSSGQMHMHMYKCVLACTYPHTSTYAHRKNAQEYVHTHINITI